MSSIRLRYVQAWVDGEGRAHHYFRRPGFKRVPLPGLPGSLEFMAAYQAAMAEGPQAIGVKRNKPGSVSAVIAAYLDSTLYFASRAAGTQAMQRPILERFREQYGDHPIGLMPQKFIVAVLAKKKPHAARNWLKALRGLCAFAKAQEWIKEDPTQGIKLPSAKSKGHHTWTDEEIAQFEAHHAIGTKARLALALGLFTVQRRSDVIRMGPQHVRNGAIQLRGQLNGQQKTSKPMVIPIRPELQAILDATPCEHLTFMVTRRGQPYTPNDFSEWFRAQCDAAELPQNCVFHGLRKAAMRQMAERGYSASEIAAWSGHETLSEIKHYTDAADQERMARNSMARGNAIATPTVKVG